MNIKPYFLINIQVREIKCRLLQFSFGPLRVKNPYLRNLLMNLVDSGTVFCNGLKYYM